MEVFRRNAQPHGHHAYRAGLGEDTHQQAFCKSGGTLPCLRRYFIKKRDPEEYRVILIVFMLCPALCGYSVVVSSESE